MLEKLKEHPAYIAIGGLLLFVLVYVFSRGGSSATGATQYVASGPSDATVQASIAAGLQQQQLQAQVITQGQSTQAQYNAAVLGFQTTQQQNSLAATVAEDQIGGTISVDKIAADSADFIASQQASSQVSIADKSYDTAALINGQNQSTQQLQITSQAASFKEQVDGEVAQSQINAGLQSDLSKTAASVILGQSADAKDVSLDQIDSGRDVSLAGIDSTNLANNLKYSYANNMLDANTQIANKVIDATTTLTLGEQSNDRDIIDSTTAIANDQLAHGAALDNGILTLIGQGKFNLGGEGGANTVAAAQAVTTGASPNPFQNAPGKTDWSAILNGAANIVKSVGTGFFG